MMRAASEWAWRLLVVAVGLVALLYLVGFLSEVIIPLVVGVLLAALLSSIHLRLARVMPRGAAAGVTVLGTLIVIGLLLALVGTQISGGFASMSDQVSTGIAQIRDYIRTTLGISDAEFGKYLDDVKNFLSSSNLSSSLGKAGVTAGHFVAGTFIALFSLFFFLYDGPRIWAWVVQLFPRTARSRIDSSGAVAWHQLSHYTRATVLVAAVDAVGITAGALILAGAVRAGHRRPGLPAVLHPHRRRVAEWLGRHPDRPCRPRARHGAHHAGGRPCSSSSRTCCNRSSSAARSESTRSASSSPSPPGRSSPASSAPSSPYRSSP